MTHGLLLWLLAGMAIAVLLPQCLGSRSMGAGGAFWLIGAPLLDLAWVWRVRGWEMLRRAAAGRRSRRQARRVPGAGCRPAL